MKILVLNCGSSSIKYQLFSMTDRVVIAKGGVEKLGMKGSFLKHVRQDGQVVVFEGEILDHKIGVEYILGILTSEKHGCLKSLEELDAVGHRVVHGGELFNSSVLLTDDVLAEVTKCIDIAPLHNPPNLKGIKAMEELIPGIPQVGVFDTAFHQTMEPKAYMYGIPYPLYKKYGIRRYGFHGTSHRYVTKRACELLGVDYNTQKIISCHLGNGASVAAIKNGKSIDTSMGFTPVEGLVMGTRSGDLDVGVVLYIMEKEEIGIKSANTLFNKHAGMLGVTGISSDMREIEMAKDKGDERAALALEMYDYKVKKYIGSYIAAMGGLDILIMTGGIGENADTTREGVLSDLDFLGISLDHQKNKGFRKEGVISTPESKVKVIVVPTDEELMIALDTEQIVTSGNKL
ncbi:acetate kinase [Aquipluma nitroreducens]|uniref:Acetate kinase n=1 Tax=Aquipluma nitroreducens TaxID=2010828 RepID=A0A5K7S4E7_9BACT|nr:acetate kinase [Aquipluma nitroreducens]BBE16441.1 acetate kinase [Aquipluma nitroreducens]